MIKIVVFLMLGSFLPLQAEETDPCLQEALRAEYQKIEELSRTKLVDDQVNSFDQQLQTCSVSLSQLGVENDLDQLRHQGWQGEAQTLRGHLEEGRSISFEHYTSVLQRLELTPTQEQRQRNVQLQQQLRQECTPVDQRAHLPEVRDQDSTGWCYAFVAADLISYKLKENISPLDIAITYNREQAIPQQRGEPTESLMDVLSDYLPIRNQSETDFRSGWVHQSMERTQDIGGFCLESDLPSEDFAFSNLATSIKKIEQIRTHFDYNTNIRNVFLLQRRNHPMGVFMAEQFVCNYQDDLRTMLPNLPMAEIIDSLMNTRTRDFFLDLSQRACRNRISFDGEVKDVRYPEASAHDKYKDMNRLLTEGNIVGITYRTRVFRDNISEHSVHASSIVGRRWNESTNQCEFLLRNSWGESCRSYREGIDCEKGNVWIPGHDLMEFTSRMTYVD